MQSFALTLRTCRIDAGMTQERLAELSGVARPNIAAYERGSREPLFRTAVALLSATGATVAIEPPVAWSWTNGLRPYPYPSRFWTLGPKAALRTFEPGPHLWWSGPTPRFDLADRAQRIRAYEIVLREGSPDDIESVIDGTLLCECWADLVLPRELRAAWDPLIVSLAAWPGGPADVVDRDS